MISDWKECKLGDIADIIMGQSPKGETCNENGEGKALLNGPTEFGSHHPSPNQYTTDPKRFAKKGDLLFCVRGSTTGRMNWADQEYAIGRGLASFHHKNGNECQPYLKAIINHNLPSLLVSATGSTFPNVSKNQIHNMEINLPPLSEQKAIAHILGSLDDKIELNHQMNQTLEHMAQALFQSWFVDFDPVIDNALAQGNTIPEEFAKHAARRKQAKSKYKPLPEHILKLFPSEFELTDEMEWIPKGWKAKTVDELISVNPTTKLPKDTVAPYVDMKALPTEGFSVQNVIQKEFKGGAKYIQGDVLLARITPCLENGKAGVVDFLNEGEVGFGSTEFIVFREKENIKTSYLACLMRLKSFKSHCVQSMVGSSGRQRVQNACFSNYYLAVPDSKEIFMMFYENVDSSFKKIRSNILEIQSLTQQRDTLLPKLISGKLRVGEIKTLLKD